jgi:hypothetical protein
MGNGKHNRQQVFNRLSILLILFLLYALITSYSERKNTSPFNREPEDPALLLRDIEVGQPEKSYPNFSNFGGFGPCWIR